MVLLYNDAFAPILTDRHPEALGEEGHEFWRDVWPVVGRQLESVLKEGRDVFHERALVPLLRNGVLQDAFFSYSYSPIFDKQGKVAGILTICQDVTSSVFADRERERAQETVRSRQEELDKTVQALHAERSRLLSVLQQAPVFFALLEGPEHRFSMVNPPYLKLAGNRDVLGKTVAEALPEALEQGYVAVLDRVYQTGQAWSAQAARFVIAPSEGEPEEERILDFIYQPLREEDGRVSGIIVLGIDISDRKRAEQTLIQTEKLAAVGRLASSIAHEINNPLESVTNLVFLAHEADSVEKAREFLELADQELRRISAITSQTLKFNKQASEPRAVTCDDLIGSVLYVYQARIRNSGIRVEKRKRASRPVVCFDGEIRQVLNNLVSNAIDAMQATGGRLLLRSRMATDWATGRSGITLTVADTGTGISRANQARMFEPFFTTKGQSGTGLGLWVSREIVARHQGTLRVRSSERAASHGTVFTLFLPI